MGEKDVNKSTAEQKSADEILHSKGVSSVEQKGATVLQSFFGSSMAFVILLEVGIIIFFGLLSKPGTFLSLNNFMNILLNSSQMVILAIGLTFVIASGHMDLSVGMTLILTSIIGAKVFKAVSSTPELLAAGEYPHLALGIVCGIIAALACGALCGAVNAFTTSKLKLVPFIATLASMYMFQGTAMVICNGAQEKNLPRIFQTYFGHRKLFDVIPYQAILAIILGVIFSLIMRYTKFGLHTRAIGSNRESARRAGIKVEATCFKIYMLMGALAGVAGCFDVARYSTTNPSGHISDSMMAIMAAVMGGTSMKGGIASVAGTMLAVLIPVSLQSGMIILGMNSYIQLIVTGLFLILAVYVDYVRNLKPKL